MHPKLSGNSYFKTKKWIKQQAVSTPAQKQRKSFSGDQVAKTWTRIVFINIGFVATKMGTSGVFIPYAGTFLSKLVVLP